MSERVSESERASVSYWMVMVFIWMVGAFVTIINIFMYALAIDYFWKWFIVPFGIQEISYWHTAGLVTFMMMLKTYGKKSSPDDKATLDLTPLIFLAIGYGFKMMM